MYLYPKEKLKLNLDVEDKTVSWNWQICDICISFRVYVLSYRHFWVLYKQTVKKSMLGGGAKKVRY